MKRSRQNTLAVDAAEAAGLSDIERRFINAYVVSRDGAKSARQAGYSSKSAKVAACRLLKRPRVKITIDNLCAGETGRARMKIDRAREILETLAEGEITEFLDRRGNIRIHGKANVRAVREIEVTEWQGKEHPKRVTKFKLHDPVSAISKLAALNGWDKAPKGSLTADTLMAEMIKAVDGKSRGVLAARLPRVADDDGAGGGTDGTSGAKP